MKRFLLTLGLLGFATRAPASCRWLGTQVECVLGGSQLMIGTQMLSEPTCARAFGPQLVQGCIGLPDDERALAEWPLRLELQSVGSDPGLCRKLGNEVYCY